MRKRKLKDLPLNMVSSLGWIYDLPMTYVYFTRHWTRRAFLRNSFDIKAENKYWTTQAEPPQQLQTRGGVTVNVWDRASTHKWLGCLLPADCCHDADTSTSSFASTYCKSMDGHVSLATRLRYFDTTIIPGACFVAGHQRI